MIMYLFETMRLEAGKIPRYAYHQARLFNSAEQLGYPLTKETFERFIQSIQQAHPTGTHRLKVMLEPSGTLTYQCVALPNKSHFTAKAQQIKTDYPKWQYINKTSHREHVEHNHETDVVLYYDNKGKVLEFDIGNVLIKENEHYYTPSFENDFLRGCMRAQLLDEGKAKEKDYDISELKRKLKAGEAEIFLVNSLREVAEIEINL